MVIEYLRLWPEIFDALGCESCANFEMVARDMDHCVVVSPLGMSFSEPVPFIGNGSRDMAPCHGYETIFLD